MHMHSLGGKVCIACRLDVVVGHEQLGVRAQNLLHLLGRPHVESTLRLLALLVLTVCILQDQ